MILNFVKKSDELIVNIYRKFMSYPKDILIDHDKTTYWNMIENIKAEVEYKKEIITVWLNEQNRIKSFCLDWKIGYVQA
jgi:hypothetical protein